MFEPINTKLGERILPTNPFFTPNQQKGRKGGLILGLLMLVGFIFLAVMNVHAPENTSYNSNATNTSSSTFSTTNPHSPHGHMSDEGGTDSQDTSDISSGNWDEQSFLAAKNAHEDMNRVMEMGLR
jgi:hypothetical protein